jgi:hypothetical protein
MFIREPGSGQRLDKGLLRWIQTQEEPPGCDADVVEAPFSSQLALPYPWKPLANII